ncbi:hypothetical protein [Bradyrhizobium sp. dw_78]|uniref:hypothetical protein n=1 Tax=Bradyrhizobium sp. dw_78 TaxID=2719793 RepID=UPI001BD50C9C|nr:hypothetical protein [Bradyrhizobium sp. dw_78]
MKISSIGTFAIAALLCTAPFSLHGSQGNGMPLSVSVTSAEAADLDLQARPYRSAHHHRSYRYSRLYNPPYCNGPYTGGGIGDINGSTYYGGPWIELHCFGGVY